MADSISTEPSTGRATLGPGQVSVTGDIALATGKTLAAGENVLVSGDKLRASHLAVGSQAAGDLLYAASSSTWARLGVGADGDVLTLDEGLPTWQAPAGPQATGGSTDQLIWSPVRRVAESGITQVLGNLPVTWGTRWLPMRQSVITGIRFYWAGTMAVTVTCKLWRPDGSVGASATVLTTTTPGIYSAPFASPYTIAAGDVGRVHFTSTYDGASYTGYGSDSAQPPYSPFWAGPYWLLYGSGSGGTGYYSNGDAMPAISGNAEAPIEPIIQS